MEKKFKIEPICLVLFVLTFVLRGLTDTFLISKGYVGQLDNIKYIPLFIGLVISIIYFIKNNIKISNEFVGIIKHGFIVIIFFFIWSLILTIKTGKFCLETINELTYISLALLYAYFTLSILKFESILLALKIVLYISITFYILEIGIKNFFTFSNYLKINFIESSSPFESNYFSGIAFVLFLFMAFYSDKKRHIIISAFFTLFTFKRVTFVFTIIILVMVLLFPKIRKIKIKTKFPMIIGILFSIITVSYFNALVNGSNLIGNITGQSLVGFTMSRNNFLYKLLNGGYVSYGFGSSTDFTSKSLEMDLIKIYIELGFPFLLIFCIEYFSMCKNNLFSTIILTVCFINLLFSFSLTSPFTWTITFMAISLVNKKGFDFNDKNFIFTRF